MIIDCWGFRASLNLDPRPTLALATMLKHPFRNRLRAAFVVDAPMSVAPLCRLGLKAVPPATAKKVKFVSSDEMPRIIAQIHGAETSNLLKSVIHGNRTAELCRPQRIPVEIGVPLAGRSAM
jgi:hypothetical protein